MATDERIKSLLKMAHEIRVISYSVHYPFSAPLRTKADEIAALVIDLDISLGKAESSKKDNARKESFEMWYDNYILLRRIANEKAEEQTLEVSGLSKKQIKQIAFLLPRTIPPNDQPNFSNMSPSEIQDWIDHHYQQLKEAEAEAFGLDSRMTG